MDEEWHASTYWYRMAYDLTFYILIVLLLLNVVLAVVVDTFTQLRNRYSHYHSQHSQHSASVLSVPLCPLPLTPHCLALIFSLSLHLALLVSLSCSHFLTLIASRSPWRSLSHCPGCCVLGEKHRLRNRRAVAWSAANHALSLNRILHVALKIMWHRNTTCAQANLSTTHY